jgi:hypothetical protein
MDLNYNITLNYNDKEDLTEGSCDSMFIGIIKENKVEIICGGEFRIIDALSILCSFSRALIEEKESYIPHHIIEIIKKFATELDIIFIDKNKMH